ncbi:MAG: alpha-L-fucosidase, partial [Alphaproteobacteria bacterium]|nr:alpha-L-fucosidase [Alphaproteobacteria bacterium]
SVPGYAPKGTFIDILGSNYDRAMVSNPYAEDYWNAMKAPDSPTGRWHRERYGSLPYEAFQPQLEADLAAWDPDAWARQFQEAGARYVVFTAKYADGYCLWPTKVANPHQPDWYSERDLIGELAAAVRGRGMKFGLYYSGGVDWTFQRQTVETLGDYAYLPYGADYADYAEAQRGLPMRTLIGKTLASVPGRRYGGLGVVLTDLLHQRAQSMGFSRVIHALQYEGNSVRNMSEFFGRVMRRYTLFSRRLT